MINSKNINEKYYAYIYYDPSRNNEPIYVGKGCRGRYGDHMRKINKGVRHPFIQRLEYMRKNGVEPIIGFYAGIDQELALFLEEELILKFGLKSQGGPLLNIKTTGNIPAGGGWKHSEEAKEKMRAAHRGKKGAPHSEESKKKIGDATRGRKHSEETKEKIKQGNKGKKKPISETTKEKLSKILKGRPKTDEWKKAIKAGLRSYHDNRKKDVI